MESTATDITALSAGEIARAVAARELSARAAVEAFVRRVEEVNPRLNAVVVERFADARREADELDARLRRGEAAGLLCGVPVTIKESFDVAGLPTTMGLSARAGRRAERDAPTVARLRAAGAVVIGKTNVPQLVLLNEADNPVYGRTNNPWDEARATGGSSGGCAAVLAAGGAALSLGSDIGGSARFPAHNCGVHGFKPTAGRLTMLGHATIFDGQEAVPAQPGPLARRVTDLALALGVLAAPGQERFDSSVAPAPLGDAGRVRLEGLRVAYFEDNGILRPAPAVRRAVREAADALRARGAVVEEWAPPSIAEAWDIYQGLLFADGLGWAHRALRGSRPDWRLRRIAWGGALPRALMRLAGWEFALVGQNHLAASFRRLGRRSAGEYWRLLESRAGYRARFVASLDAGRFDALLCPPEALPAAPHGASFYLTDSLSYGSLFNLLGLPAGVVAATRVRPGEESDRPPSLDLVERAARKAERGSAGLPVGVQVAARLWREDVALAVMCALEEHFRALPDYPARPPVQPA